MMVIILRQDVISLEGVNVVTVKARLSDLTVPGSGGLRDSLLHCGLLLLPIAGS